MVGKAPAVTKGLNYERILKAREAEPHNWLTYYGGYDGQRYSLLDQINASQRQEPDAGVGLPGRHRGHAIGRGDVLDGGLPDRRRRRHVPHGL